MAIKQIISGEEREAIWNDIYTLPDKVREYFLDHSFEYMSMLFSEIKECESPIEQLLGIELCTTLERNLLHGGLEAVVNSQREINIEGKTYRVDFLIGVQSPLGNSYFVIECDGHDYHERTKEQARRDREKDRKLQGEGYTVIRFTGSEIFENPRACIRDIVKIISSYYLSEVRQSG